MAEHTSPYVASIVGIREEGDCHVVGSGLFLAVGGGTYLVSGKRAVETANVYPLGAGFMAVGDAAPHMLCATPYLANYWTELSVHVLSPAPTGEGPRGWPACRIDTARAERARDHLFVHGFPRRGSPDPFGGPHRRPLHHVVMERHQDLPGDLRAHEFAMDYDPASGLSPQDEDMARVNPHKLCGSPVFRIGAEAKPPEEWGPDQSMLVGIVSGWDFETNALLATGTEALLELLGLITKTSSPR